MRRPCASIAVAVAAVLAVASVPSAAQQQTPEQITVPLSDAGRPALVKVDLVAGSVTVRGADRRDISITVRPGADGDRRRVSPAAGNLRRLAQSPGIEVTEERNEVSIDASPSRPVILEILVPVRTNLTLSTVGGGEVVVEGVDGEIELDNVNGSIVVRDASGSVVANTVNGHVTATLSRLTAQKAMAFTSLNGNVDVTFPSSLRANLKLRSDNGEVLTDFDVQLRPAPAATVPARESRGRFRIEVNRAIYGAVGGGGPEIELRSFNGDVFVRRAP